jgi:amidase
MKPEAQWEVERALRLSAMDVFEAASGRSKWIRAVDAAFERYDYLVLPSSQCFPFEAALAWPKSIGGRVMDVYHRWMEVAVPATMAGCPALSVPVGLAVSGKPMGMQIIAARTRDLACLRLARAYEIGAEIETRAHRAARAAGPEIATWTR